MNQVGDAGFSSVKGNAYKSTSASYVVRGGITKAYSIALVLLQDGSFFNALQRNRKEKIMYQKVSTDLNFVQREKEVEKFWKDNNIFKKSMEQ